MNTELLLQLDNGVWAEINPSRCECHRGYLTTDWDTIHQCPFHGVGVPHPEDEEGWETFDWDSHQTSILKDAYFWFFENSPVVDGEEFATFCLSVSEKELLTHQDWVDAAETVYQDFKRESSEKIARSRGYSCALEMRLTEDL